MKTPTAKELAAIARVCAVAAAEKKRSDWWQLIDLLDRQRALCVAGLPRARATDTLASFSDSERAGIKLAISVHLSRMELIARCFDPSNTSVDGYLR